jgi:hypothetical protein
MEYVGSKRSSNRALFGAGGFAITAPSEGVSATISLKSFTRCWRLCMSALSFSSFRWGWSVPRLRGCGKTAFDGNGPSLRLNSVSKTAQDLAFAFAQIDADDGDIIYSGELRCDFRPVLPQCLHQPVEIDRPI